MKPAIHRTILGVLLLVLGGSTFPSVVEAQTQLSEEALFRRCYAHLTQLRPKLNDSLLAQVKAGSKTAVQACQEVFDRARFTANGGTEIADPNDAVARAVVHTFNELHRSWAREQVLFPVNGGGNNFGSETWFEDSPMGPYVTRALFAPNGNVDSVTQGSDYLQPVRQTMNPPHVYGSVPSSTVGSERDWRLGADHPFAPRGDILGVRPVSLPPISFFAAARFTDLSSMPDLVNIGVDPAATQSLSTIDFPTIDTVKGPLTEVEHFAIRITGTLSVPSAGSYTLYLNVDDAGFLLLDGNRVLNRTGVGESSVVLALTAGQHPFEIHYRQRNTLARLVLSWAGPGFGKRAIQSTALSNVQARYYTHSQALQFQFTKNEGGGFLGNHNYLLTTFLEGSPTFTPDGALATNRSWARAVFSDALCREIPVVREEDVQQFVLPNSPLAFRQAAPCNACHASLDGGLSGLIRSLAWNPLNGVVQDSPLPDLFGLNSMVVKAPLLGEMTTWSDIADSDYSRRAPFGRFFYRNLHGQLVNQQVRTMEELGAAIRSQDDYYACFAKRYYHYFMGIDVELGDPGAPGYAERNDVDEFHYSRVLALADHLKTSKSLSQLVSEIISSPQYGMTDYGVSHTGGE